MRSFQALSRAGWVSDILKPNKIAKCGISVTVVEFLPHCNVIPLSFAIVPCQLWMQILTVPDSHDRIAVGGRKRIVSRDRRAAQAQLGEAPPSEKIVRVEPFHIVAIYNDLKPTPYARLERRTSKRPRGCRQSPGKYARSWQH